MDKYGFLPHLKDIQTMLQSDLKDARFSFDLAQRQFSRAWAYKEAMAFGDKDGPVPQDVLDAYDEANVHAKELAEKINEFERRLETIEAYSQHLRSGEDAREIEITAK